MTDITKLTTRDIEDLIARNALMKQLINTLGKLVIERDNDIMHLVRIMSESAIKGIDE